MTEEGHFRRDERCIPFMLGKRYCIGQVQIFVAFAVVVVFGFVVVIGFVVVFGFVVVIIGKRDSIGQVQISVAFAVVVGKKDFASDKLVLLWLWLLLLSL
jgi:hypothetical protein